MMEVIVITVSIVAIAMYVLREGFGRMVMATLKEDRGNLHIYIYTHSINLGNPVCNVFDNLFYSSECVFKGTGLLC